MCSSCVTPCRHTVSMLINAAKQIEKHLAGMLVGVKSDRASTSDMRETLALSKVLISQLAMFQTITAATVAKRESHGDGGTGMLHNSTGISKHKARKQIRTAEALGKLPAVREALEDGKITFGNADALARASLKTDPEAVQTDRELLKQAEVMPEDQFVKRARVWTAQHQHDHGEADYKRMRSRRYLRIWNGDDGMTHLHGQFDPVTGARIHSRLDRAALKLYKQDKKHQRQAAQPNTKAASHTTKNSQTKHNNDSGQTNSGSNMSGRSFEQCRADAFEKLFASGRHNSDNTCKENIDNSGDSSDGGCNGVFSPTAEILVYADLAALETSNDHNNTEINPTGTNNTISMNGAISRKHWCKRKKTTERRTPARKSATNRQGIAEIAGGTPIPPSVLERLMCNARITGLLFNGPGRPLWCGRTRRTVNSAQLKALQLRDKKCIGCGAHPSMCQAHHIVPWSQGGRTDLDNLTLVCYQCHHKIHDNNWQIVTENDKLHLRPPNPHNNTNHYIPMKHAQRKHLPSNTTRYQPTNQQKLGTTPKAAAARMEPLQVIPHTPPNHHDSKTRKTSNQPQLALTQ